MVWCRCFRRLLGNKVLRWDRLLYDVVYLGGGNGRVC